MPAKQDQSQGSNMSQDRLSAAEEAARETEMRKRLAACPRILDLVARGPLADPERAGDRLSAQPARSHPVTVSNDS